jgi:uncharacterized Zn ribbon protein
MTRIEESEKTCNDCSTELLYDNGTHVYGCRECEKAWSMETLEGWFDANEMPPKQYKYSEYFG